MKLSTFARSGLPSLLKSPAASAGPPPTRRSVVGLVAPKVPSPRARRRPEPPARRMAAAKRPPLVRRLISAPPRAGSEAIRRGIRAAGRSTRRRQRARAQAFPDIIPPADHCPKTTGRKQRIKDRVIEVFSGGLRAVIIAERYALRTGLFGGLGLRAVEASSAATRGIGVRLSA